MKLSPNYETIKARAIELLTAPDGFNGYGPADIPALDSYARNNNIGVALCIARDEIEPRAAARRPGRFNIGNFNRAAVDLRRYLATLR